MLRLPGKAVFTLCAASAAAFSAALCYGGSVDINDSCLDGRRPVIRGVNAEKLISTDRSGKTSPEKTDAHTAKMERSSAYNVPYDIPLTYNETVGEFVDYFQNRGSKYYRKWLTRSTRYIPVIREILKEYRLPEDTVYLAMIESGFSTFALSKSGAGGIWQFIPATATRYGLVIDYWRDERRDPVKSTHAAAMYLRDLYNYFGSWWLAWAGYNSGEGRIFKAVERFDTSDFWELSGKPFLRSETKEYVPKLIAAAFIAKHPDLFGFDDVEYLAPMVYDQVEIPSPTDLRVVANMALSDLETIEALNPELRRGCTPPGLNSYKIRIPVGAKERFTEVFQFLEPGERLKTDTHTVVRGDTLSTIARAAGQSVRLLAEFNGLAGVGEKTKLAAGTVIVIPRLYIRNDETEEQWDKKLRKSQKRQKVKKNKAKYGSKN